MSEQGTEIRGAGRKDFPYNELNRLRAEVETLRGQLVATRESCARVAERHGSEIDGTASQLADSRWQEDMHLIVRTGDDIANRIRSHSAMPT